MTRDCLEDLVVLRELAATARLAALRYGRRPDFFIDAAIYGRRRYEPAGGKRGLLQSAWPTLEETFDAVTARDLLAACRSILNMPTPARPWADFASRAWKV